MGRWQTVPRVRGFRVLAENQNFSNTEKGEFSNAVLIPVHSSITACGTIPRLSEHAAV